MKWWQWDITKPAYNKGGVFDPETYAGLFRGIVFCTLGFWVFWQISDWSLNMGLGTPRDHQWGRLVIMVLVGLNYIIILAAAINIFLQRRKLKKSTEGQWYDTKNLTKRDLGLEYNGSEDEESKPEIPVQSDGHPKP